MLHRIALAVVSEWCQKRAGSPPSRDLVPFRHRLEDVAGALFGRLGAEGASAEDVRDKKIIELRRNCMRKREQVAGRPHSSLRPRVMRAAHDLFYYLVGVEDRWDRSVDSRISDVCLYLRSRRWIFRSGVRTRRLRIRPSRSTPTICEWLRADIALVERGTADASV